MKIEVTGSYHIFSYDDTSKFCSFLKTIGIYSYNVINKWTNKDPQRFWNVVEFDLKLPLSYINEIDEQCRTFFLDHKIEYF